MLNQQWYTNFINIQSFINWKIFSAHQGFNICITPALFKEESGVVAEGSFVGKTFVATNLLAKHDENYMPPKAAGAEHITKTLKE